MVVQTKKMNNKILEIIKEIDEEYKDKVKDWKYSIRVSMAKNVYRLEDLIPDASTLLERLKPKQDNGNDN